MEKLFPIFHRMQLQIWPHSNKLNVGLQDLEDRWVLEDQLVLEDRWVLED